MVEYIERNALIEHIKKDPLYDLVEQYGITGVIESFPTADVQPVKHGRWKWSEGGQCSECGFHNSNFGYSYCPNCGADMRGE